MFKSRGTNTSEIAKDGYVWEPKKYMDLDLKQVFIWANYMWGEWRAILTYDSFRSYSLLEGTRRWRVVWSSEPR